MGSGLIIGVDGGGTRTVAVAAQADGTLVGCAIGPGVNYNHNIGMEGARENLRKTVDALLVRCGAQDFDRLLLGLSALDQDADSETVRSFAGNCFDPAKLRIHSDAYVALIGATLGQPGTLMVCGTGSILLQLDAQGQQHVCLGWGTLLGDPGSAYTLALEGLQAAIAAWEQIGPETALTAATERYFSLSAPRELIDRIYDEGMAPDQIAQFARPVLAAAEQGDTVALGILHDNMRRLGAKCAQAIGEHPDTVRVILHGGVFQHSPQARALFVEELSAHKPDAWIAPSAYPPAIGAVLCHFLEKGSLDASVRDRIQASKGVYHEGL